MQHRVPAQCAARVCARAHLAYAHEHSIIHFPAGYHRVPHSVRVCALAGARMRASRHAILDAHGARRRSAILEHANHVQNRSGESTGDREARVRPGALGGAGSGALILPGGAGRGPLVRAPRHPCQPWSSLAGRGRAKVKRSGDGWGRARRSRRGGRGGRGPQGGGKGGRQGIWGAGRKGDRRQSRGCYGDED